MIPKKPIAPPNIVYRGLKMLKWNYIRHILAALLAFMAGYLIGYNQFATNNHHLYKENIKLQEELATTRGYIDSMNFRDGFEGGEYGKP